MYHQLSTLKRLVNQSQIKRKEQINLHKDNKRTMMKIKKTILILKTYLPKSLVLMKISMPKIAKIKEKLLCLRQKSMNSRNHKLKNNRHNKLIKKSKKRKN